MDETVSFDRQLQAGKEKKQRCVNQSQKVTSRSEYPSITYRDQGVRPLVGALLLVLVDSSLSTMYEQLRLERWI